VVMSKDGNAYCGPETLFLSTNGTNYFLQYRFAIIENNQIGDPLALLTDRSEVKKERTT
jgi:hypothetical protein